MRTADRLHFEVSETAAAEVRFAPSGPEQTTVELEHRHLDRLVAGQAIHDTIGQGGGWTAILETFAKSAEADK